MLELQAGSDESLDPEVVGVSRLGLGRWILRQQSRGTKRHRTHHHQESKVSAAQRLPNVHLLPVRVPATPSIQQLLHCYIARQDDECLCAEDQAVHWAILSSPLLELQMGISRGHLEMKSIS